MRLAAVVVLRSVAAACIVVAVIVSGITVVGGVVAGLDGAQSPRGLAAALTGWIDFYNRGRPLTELNNPLGSYT